MKHRAAGTGHPQHLVGHPPRVGHVLEDVGGVADVDGAVAERQLHAAADRPCRSPMSPEPGQLADVGVEGEVRRPARAERVAEVARAAADVEQQRARRGRRTARPAAAESCGQRGVEAGRVRLLVAELPQEPHRPAAGRRARAGVRGGRAPGGRSAGTRRPYPRDSVCAPMSDHAGRSRGRHVAFLSWRDTHNPEGGGAERYLEKMAEGLVARGARVTIFCAAHAAAPPDEIVDGVRFVRRGSKLTVYQEGLRGTRSRRDLGHVDVVVDVQNGLPFFTRARHPRARRGAGAPRAPRAVAGRLPRPRRPGRLVDRAPPRAPALPPLPVRRRLPGHPRRAARASASTGPRIAVVHNGTDPVVATGAGKSAHPTHRGGRAAGPAQAGRARHRRGPRAARAAPGPAPARRRQRLVGGRAARVRRRARAPATRWSSRGTSTRRASTRSTRQAWVLALPSLKEGWGLVVGEAGMHRTPDRRLPRRPAAPASRSRTDGQDCSSTTRDELTDALGTLLDGRTRCAAGSATGASADEPPVHLGARPGVLRARRRGSAAGASASTPRTPRRSRTSDVPRWSREARLVTPWWCRS